MIMGRGGGRVIRVGCHDRGGSGREEATAESLGHLRGVVGETCRSEDGRDAGESAAIAPLCCNP